MTTQTTVYIVLDWQEEGPLDFATGQRIWLKGRRVCTPTNYAMRLPCSNPECVGGGFEVGDRIAAMLAQNLDKEQNSLICSNAIHEDRAKRCLHIIRYLITCIYPYRRVPTKSKDLSQK